MSNRLPGLLHRAETLLRRFARRQVTGRAQRDADMMAAEVGIEVQHESGGAYDAFTHAYVSARLAIRVSPDLARRLGDLNEIFGSLAVGRTLEAEMDQHNNEVGREIGSRLSGLGKTSRRRIAKSVKEALDAGKLRVIDTSRDPATLVPSGPTGLKTSERGPVP